MDGRDGLARFAEEVQDVILCLRQEGLVLSAIDQHVLTGWWEAGLPTGTVLQTLWTSGRRLLARKHPPRGLPLRQLDKAVRREGEKARLRGVGAGLAGEAARGPAPGEAPSAALIRHVAGLLAGQEADDRLRPTLDAIRATFAALPAPDSDGEWVGALFAAAHRYYDALGSTLPSDELQVLHERAAATLGPSARALCAAERDATIAELIRRELRARDPAFDPEPLLDALL